MSSVEKSSESGLLPWQWSFFWPCFLLFSSSPFDSHGFWVRNATSVSSFVHTTLPPRQRSSNVTFFTFSGWLTFQPTFGASVPGANQKAPSCVGCGLRSAALNDSEAFSKFSSGTSTNRRSVLAAMNLVFVGRSATTTVPPTSLPVSGRPPDRGAWIASVVSCLGGTRGAGSGLIGGPSPANDEWLIGYGYRLMAGLRPGGASSQDLVSFVRAATSAILGRGIRRWWRSAARRAWGRRALP